MKVVLVSVRSRASGSKAALIARSLGVSIADIVWGAYGGLMIGGVVSFNFFSQVSGQ